MQLARVVALLACASLSGACLRSNADGVQRNPNGPGSQSSLPHNTSGPGVKNTAGWGYYGSESWPSGEPGYGFSGSGGQTQQSTIFSTDQPGTTNALPGSGNNGWGGPASPSDGVTGNGIAPWTH